jgi:hypothetical protein
MDCERLGASFALSNAGASPSANLEFLYDSAGDLVITPSRSRKVPRPNGKAPFFVAWRWEMI